MSEERTDLDLFQTLFEDLAQEEADEPEDLLAQRDEIINDAIRDYLNVARDIRSNSIRGVIVAQPAQWRHLPDIPPHDLYIWNMLTTDQFSQHGRAAEDMAEVGIAQAKLIKNMRKLDPPLLVRVAHLPPEDRARILDSLAAADFQVEEIIFY